MAHRLKMRNRRPTTESESGEGNHPISRGQIGDKLA